MGVLETIQIVFEKVKICQEWSCLLTAQTKISA